MATGMAPAGGCLARAMWQAACPTPPLHIDPGSGRNSVASWQGSPACQPASWLLLLLLLQRLLRDRPAAAMPCQVSSARPLLHLPRCRRSQRLLAQLCALHHGPALWPDIAPPAVRHRRARE